MTTKLLNGYNHVATLTPDLDRLIAFYREVFDAEVVMDLFARGLDLRHAGIELGEKVFLHAWEVPEENVTAAGNEMFRRGRLDHLALSAPDEEALREVEKRLKSHGIETGFTDFGNIMSVWFEDPDGMGLEVSCFKAGATWADAKDPEGPPTT